MKNALLFLSILFFFSCETTSINDSENSFSENNDKEMNTDLNASNDPYNIFIRFNQENALEILIELKEGNYFASPNSKNQMMGAFDVNIDTSDDIIFSHKIQESPSSHPSYDKFAKEEIYWVNESTTYTINTEFISDEDFEIDGLVQFVIEPKCTMEKTLFRITNENKKLTVTTL